MRSEIAQIIKKDKVMELAYGNCSDPKQILGRHMLGNGQVISAFHPDAVSMCVIDESGRRYDMDAVERSRLFATFIPSLKKFSYRIEMHFRDGNQYISEDPYCYSSQITSSEEDLFLAGNWIDCYKKMGAHPMTIHGVKGVYFAVWAPNARRVSVVGSFNFWNGMIYPMNRLERTGIFELFIPNVFPKDLYRFEVKDMDSNIRQKTDPFGSINLDGSSDTSIILDPKEFHWTDKHWMRDRSRHDWVQTPFAVCDGEYMNQYQEELLDTGCFTHVLLETPTYGHGIRGKIRGWINSLHEKNIGVILQINLGLFPMEANGLSYFDGTCLYGHADERIHFDEKKQMYRFYHHKKEVCGYLLANLLFWVREYHVDGFLFEDITEMLFPSYTTEQDGQKKKHVLFQQSAEDFLCEAAKTVKKEDSSVLLISDEKQERDTHSSELLFSKAPFDAMINYSIPANLREYIIGATADGKMSRGYYKLSLPLMKNGLRRTILNVGLENTVHFEKEFTDKVFLNEYDRLSWNKLTAGYMMGAAGKKRWSWRKMMSAPFQNYMRNLFQIYLDYNCMYFREPLKTSFQWINGMDAQNSIISFVRRTAGGGKSLLFICNFDRKKKEGYRVGVPKFGEYRLILNSDWEEFGGAVRSQALVMDAMSQEWDLQPYSLRLTISGLSVLIFEY